MFFVDFNYINKNIHLGKYFILLQLQNFFITYNNPLYNNDFLCQFLSNATALNSF